MKRFSLWMALLCVSALLSVGTALAGEGIVAIDHVQGQYRNDTLNSGTNLRFVLRFTNNVGARCDIANGYRVSSPDGAAWDSAKIDSCGPFTLAKKTLFKGIFSAAYKWSNFFTTSPSGSPDTMSFLGAGNDPSDPTQQLPVGFSDTVMAINVWSTATAQANNGKHICIDSAFFRPGGTWSWVDTALIVHTPELQGLTGQIYNVGTRPDRWDAGYCFLLYDSATPKATLGVTPSSFTFGATEGGTNPTPQMLHITAATGGPLPYNLNMYSDWLVASKLVGTTPDSVAYYPNITGLAAGTHIDSIQVASPTATNSPIYVKVTLNIAAKPKLLSVKPDTLSFSGIENGSAPPTQNFNIAEVGGAAINFVASKSVTATWVTLTNPSGTTPGAVTVGVSLASIPPGDYFDSVIVTSVGAGNSPQWGFVKLHVTAQETKTLVTTPDTLFFAAQESGVNPPGQYFQVKEIANKVIPYAVAKNAPWLSLNKTSGNTPDSVGVSIDITGLAANTYMDSLAVTSSDPVITNSRKVFVKLTVAACPILLASKTQYYDTVFVGQPAVIGDSVKITSSGDVLNWAVTDTGAGFAIPIKNGTTPGTVLFTFNRTYEVPGTMVSCFTVSTAVPVLRRANKDCTSSLQVCVTTLVKERPCVQLFESDTALFFDEFQGDGLPSKPFAVHTSDSTRPVHFKITRPAEATWLFFVNGADTTAEFDGISSAHIQVLARLAGLTPATYNANCTVASTDSIVCAPGSLSFEVILNVKKVIIPSTDTLLISNVPAVPGSQVPVPINFVNSCPLVELSAALAWDRVNLHLDSVSFLGSRFAGGTNHAQIDNTLGQLHLDANAPNNQTVPSGSGLLANLYFSVNPLATPGAYQLMPIDSPGPGIFERRKCTDSITTETPEFIKGGIVTDTATDFVCGWVVDPEGVQIPGATVQLWGAFPQGSPEMMTTSTGIGSFAFSGIHTTPFDMYAYKDGYYPGLLTKQNFGAKGVKIVLKPLAPLNPTSEWVDYFCQTNTLFGGPIPIGSVVEAMDGNLLVGRWVVTEVGKYGFMPVYRANDQFGDNGAKTNDVMTFFVDGYAAMTDGNTIYPAAYAQEQVCLDAGATITKSCTLQSGWNLISWNVDTPSDSITAVLNSIAGCVDVVLGYEGGGLTYDPALPQFSTLWFADHLSGYWIKIKPECSATLTLTGLPVNPSTAIPVYTGWNLVSYLPDGSMTPDNGFASVLSNLFVAYGSDQNGNIKVFKPGQPLNNTLENLATCNGYWLKMNSDGVLVYPGGGPATVAIESPRAKAARQAAAVGDVKATTSWMNLYSRSLMLDGKPVAAGANVDAVTSQGVKIGHFTLKQNGVFGFMPVYSDAGSSETVTGLKPGDKFALTVNGVTVDQAFVWSNNGDRLEVTNLTSKNNGNGALPTTYSLAQNYPNPFNPTTTISFALPTAGNARIEVYNVLGALVAVPFDGALEAGNHQVVWDGKDTRGQSVASGVYFYRMSAGSYTETKKMMLLK